MHAEGYEWINHQVAPTVIASHDFRITVREGGTGCTQPYSASVFNISAMSFGALSANAILALKGGARKGGFAHDTGEGSISQHHRLHGGDLIWEIGSSCFACPKGVTTQRTPAASRRWWCPRSWSGSGASTSTR